MDVSNHYVLVAMARFYGEVSALVRGNFPGGLRDVNSLEYNLVGLGAARCCLGRRRHFGRVSCCVLRAADMLSDKLHVSFCGGSGVGEMFLYQLWGESWESSEKTVLYCMAPSVGDRTPAYEVQVFGKICFGAHGVNVVGGMGGCIGGWGWVWYVGWFQCDTVWWWGRKL